MAELSFKLKNPTLLSLEGEILKVDGKSVTIRYKRPRRSVMSELTINPFVAVFGEEGELGSVYYFDNSSEFELEGEIGETDPASGLTTIVGEISGIVNTDLVAIHAFVEKVEETKKKKKKGKKAKAEDDEEDEAPRKKKKKKKK